MLYKKITVILFFLLSIFSSFSEEIDYKKELKIEKKIKKKVKNSISPKKNLSEFELLKESYTIKNKKKSRSPYQEYFNDLADNSKDIYDQFEASVDSYEIVMERAFNTLINPGALEFQSKWQKSEFRIKLNSNLIPKNTNLNFDYKWVKNELKLNIKYDVKPDDFTVNLNYNFLTSKTEAVLTIYLF